MSPAEKRRSGAAILLVLACAPLLVLRSFTVRAEAGSTELQRLVVEVESDVDDSERVDRLFDFETSGGAYAAFTGWDLQHPRYGVEISAELSIPVEIPQAATYFTWVRAKWNGICANSVTFDVRPPGTEDPPGISKQRHLVGNDAVHGIWHWVPGPELELEAGTYELLLGTRETSANVDCVLLTTGRARPNDDEIGDHDHHDHDHGPRGVDAVEYAHNFASGDTAGATPSGWSLDSAGWGTTSYLGLDAFGPSEAQEAFAQAPVEPFGKGFVRASVVVPPRAGGGLFFGRGEPDEACYIVRLAGPDSPKDYAGRVQLGLGDPESFRELASAPAHLVTGHWVELEIWVMGEVARVYLGGALLFEAPLPRDSTGSAGLYADAHDPGLPSEHSLAWPVPLGAEAGTVSAGALRLYQGKARKDIRGLVVLDEAGRGISVGLRNVRLMPQLLDDYAKLLEVRLLGEGWPEGAGPSRQRYWGVYPSGLVDSLEMLWTDEGVDVRFAAEPVLGIDGAFRGQRAALLLRSHARALFGDLLIRPFERERMPPIAWAEDAATYVGESGTSTVQSLGLYTHSLPAVVDLHFDGSEGSSLLRVEANGDGSLTCELEGVQGAWPPDPQRVSFDAFASGVVPIHLVHFQTELFVCVGDAPVFAAQDDGFPSFQLDVLRGSATPFVDVTRADTFFRRRWQSFAYELQCNTEESFAIGGPIRLGVPYRAGLLAGQSEVAICADPAVPGSGYRLQIVPGVQTELRLSRNDELLYSGNLFVQDGAEGLLTFSKVGGRILLHDDDRTYANIWDPNPLYGGVALWRHQGFAPPESVAQRMTLWDHAALFHTEIDPNRALARWKLRRGQWGIDRRGQVASVLTGIPDRGGRASMAFARELEAEHLSVEARFGGMFLQGPARLRIETGDDEGIVLEKLAEGIFSCAVVRGGRRAITPSGLRISVEDPSFTLGLVRDPTGIEVHVDGVREARLDVPAAGPARALRVILDSTSGDLMQIGHVALSVDPDSPLGLEPDFGRLLQGLSAAIAR